MTSREEVLKSMHHIFTNGELEMYYTTPFMVFRVDNRKYWSAAGKEEALSDENDILNRSLEGQANITYGDEKITHYFVANIESPYPSLGI